MDQVMKAFSENKFFKMEDKLSCISAFHFLEGAKWADSNPPEGVIDLGKIWHDPEDIPVEEGRRYQILIRLNTGETLIIYLPDELEGCKLTEKTWKSYINEIGITRWTYLKDISPKKEN